MTVKAMGNGANPIFTLVSLERLDGAVGNGQFIIINFFKEYFRVLLRLYIFPFKFLKLCRGRFKIRIPLKKITIKSY